MERCAVCAKGNLFLNKHMVCGGHCGPESKRAKPGCGRVFHLVCVCVCVCVCVNSSPSRVHADLCVSVHAVMCAGLPEAVISACWCLVVLVLP
jgi:hypothetical protein